MTETSHAKKSGGSGAARTRGMGELERVIMDQLWSADQALTVRDVYTALSENRDIAYTTVMTVLDRLTKKQLVDRERDGRAWRYRPATGRDELAAEIMDTALGEDVQERTAALVAFADRVSPDEAALLLEALAAVEANRSSGPPHESV
ncbi:BlaI/MecI/CopY family transcriptional regulator [Naumannella halotolerans]|uniref:BlaI/MecI/CopY family transcriptional regulator n=1 Tax=Naumannella halotolerans TaxID=993414 RepID=UPI00370D83AF